MVNFFLKIIILFKKEKNERKQLVQAEQVKLFEQFAQFLLQF